MAAVFGLRRGRERGLWMEPLRPDDRRRPRSTSCRAPWTGSEWRRELVRGIFREGRSALKPAVSLWPVHVGLFVRLKLPRAVWRSWERSDSGVRVPSRWSTPAGWARAGGFAGGIERRLTEAREPLLEFGAGWGDRDEARR